MNTRHSNTTSVLMFPWLAHGHISPFLELSKNLTNRNFHIYFCSSPVNLKSIKPKLSEKYSSRIQFVELNLPSLPDLPPHYHTTNGLPPCLMSTLKEAFDMASGSFFNILKSLNPDLLVYDFLQPWAPTLAFSLNIPSVCFLSTSAVMSSICMHFFKYSNTKFPFPQISLRDYEVSNFEKVLGSDNVNEREMIQCCFERSCKIILLKTFKEIEGKYIDYLSSLVEKKIVPVGPLVQVDHDGSDSSEIIEWLDKKEKSSTIFVSFGSEYFLSSEEMEDIAHGLELSKVNFIWVVRFPMGDQRKIINGVEEKLLPQGFLEKNREKGKVVEGWAPQAEILRHESIGGFVSHCGWSSVMESMKFGVPIIAIPMQLDQPLNARLVEETGVGMEVRREKNGRLEREKVAEMIREVVVERNGERVRKKVREVSEKLKRKGDEEIDEVVEELMKLCYLPRRQREE